MARQLGKIITKQDWSRLLLHLPWGLLGAFIQSWRTDFGIVAIAQGYEAFNDWRKQDLSYKDVLGIVWGYILGCVILWGV